MALVLLSAIGIFCLSLVASGGGMTVQVLVKVALFGGFLLLLWQLKVVSTEDLVRARQQIGKLGRRGNA